MSTQVNEIHNLDAVLCATVEFRFAKSAISPADAALRGYRNLGNFVTGSPKTDIKTLEHEGSYQGRLIVDKVVGIGEKLQFELKGDELKYENLKLLFVGDDLGDLAQAASTLEECDTQVFTAEDPAKLDTYYDLFIDGERRRDLTAVAMASAPQVTVTATNATELISEAAHTKVDGDAVVFTSGTMPTGLTAGQIYYVRDAVASTSYKLALTPGGTVVTFSTDGADLKINSALIEGTDFTVDLRTGSVTYLTALAVTAYPYVSCPAIAAGDEGFMKTFTPLGEEVQFEGFGRLLVYDRTNGDNVVALDYSDFSCSVICTDMGDFDGKKWVDFTLQVTVTGTRGVVAVRQSMLAA